MPKVTFSDIAARAGVGTATVERVLNARGGVKPGTVAKVVAAARALNYPRVLPEEHRGILRIEAVMVRQDSSFFRRLSKAFLRISRTLDRSVSVHRTFLDEMDPLTIAAHINSPAQPRAGLILCVPDHPAVVEAIETARERGEHVLQVVTGSSRQGGDFVGIDNYAVGRTAALFLSTMQLHSGTVVVLSHSQIYQVHRERVRGFSDYMQERSPAHLRFVAALFGQDEVHASADELQRALMVWPDLVGLYNAGGANAGVLSVLRRCKPEREICFVGHELTDNTAKALRDGSMSVVLDQAPEAQARRAMDIVLSRLNILDLPVENPPIRFVTITPENI